MAQSTLNQFIKGSGAAAHWSIEPQSIYRALRHATPGYTRRQVGTEVIHTLVGGVGETLVSAEFKFNRSAAAFFAISSTVINVREPGVLGQQTRCYNSIDTLVLFDDPDVQELYRKLYEVAGVFDNNREVDYLKDQERIADYNKLTGLDARIVVVDGHKLGRIDQNIGYLPVFAQRIFLVEDDPQLSGRQVTKLAREARKLIEPWLADVRTTADLANHVDKKSIDFIDDNLVTFKATPLQMDCRAVVVDGELLVLSNSSSETVKTTSAKVNDSIRAFTSKVMSDLRKSRL